MKINKYYKVLIIVMLLSIISPVSFPISNTITAKAASITISKKTLTLKAGETSLLKIIGTKQKVTWTTSSKEIATVSSSGKVTGVNVGKATITATVNKKKYSCKIKVIMNAPFDVQEITTDDFEYLIPKDWYYEYDSSLYMCPKESLDTGDTSSIELYIYKTNIDTSDYSIMKPILEEDMTEEKVTSFFSDDLISGGIITDNTQISYSDFKTSDYKTALGTSFKIEFNIKIRDEVRKEAIYYLYINNYCLVLYTDDMNDSLKPNALTVGEYILSSIHLKD